jgi:hypothetical protein
MAETRKPPRRARSLRAVSAEQDHAGMLLRQMGADVKDMHGLICLVRFPAEDGEVTYVYTLNAEDEYYLQRVAPCPMSAGVFPSADAIAAFIQSDVRAFQNAAQCGRYPAFVALSSRLTALARALEDAFLRCDVPGDYLDEAEEDVDALEKRLAEMKENALFLFSEKEK